MWIFRDSAAYYGTRSSHYDGGPHCTPGPRKYPCSAVVPGINRSMDDIYRVSPSAGGCSLLSMQNEGTIRFPLHVLLLRYHGTSFFKDFLAPWPYAIKCLSFGKSQFIPPARCYREMLCLTYLLTLACTG